MGSHRRHRIGKNRGALLVSNSEDGEKVPDSRSQPECSEGEVVCLRGGAALRWTLANEASFILTSSGYGSSPREHLALESLAELRTLCGDDSTLGYRGCDHNLHYFVLVDQRIVSIPRHQWHVTAMPVGLGWCIPLVFEDERLIVPPRNWAAEADLSSLQWTLSP